MVVKQARNDFAKLSILHIFDFVIVSTVQSRCTDHVQL